MHDFLEDLHANPNALPHGTYAMWFPCAEEPRFTGSAGRAALERALRASWGVEERVLAAILVRVGRARDVDAVALPDELTMMPLKRGGGWGNPPMVLSASTEKGVRLHFHESAPAAARWESLDSFALLCDTLRLLTPPRSARAGDAAEANPASSAAPAAWWSLTDCAIRDAEADGQAVGAIGQIVV